MALHRFVLAGTLIVAVGCNVGEIRDPGGGGGDDDDGDADGGPGPPGPDASPEELQFAGISSAKAGSDALTASWIAATGPGGVEYTLFITTVDGSPVTEVATSDTTAVASGLPDGEYNLRVEATDSLGRRDDGGVVLAQLIGENRVVKRSVVNMSTGAADVWGEGDIIVVAAKSNGLSAIVVDVSNVNNPRVLASINNEGYVKDIKIGDGLLMLNGEGGSYGARIFDFTDPSNPVRLSRISSPSDVHNIGYENGYLYLTDNSSGSVKIADVTDPENPEIVATWWPPSSSVHDQSIVDGKMYTAWWSGFAVTDVSDPTNPVDLVVHYYSGSASANHNSWPSKDGSFVLTSDETGSGQLRIFDVRDPDNVEQIADWSPSRDHIIHNVLVRGDYAFIAYYSAGMRVVDISDPFNPVEVGVWDEESGSGSYSGTWGVWPFGNHVAISSMRYGLILVDFFPIVVRADGSYEYPPE